MKLWSHVCFLVLVSSSSSSGARDDPTVAPTSVLANTSTSDALQSINETSSGPPPDPSPQSPAWGNETTTTLSESETQSASGDGEAVTHGNAPTTATVAMTTGVTWSNPVVSTGSSSWAYVILVFIILVIIVLCIILYFLRKASRTYSFDLQRPTPFNNLNQPRDTFEHIYLDNLESPEDGTTTEDGSRAVNGTGARPEGGGEEKASTEHCDANANGVEAPLTGNVSPKPGEDAANMLTDLLVDPIGQEQTESNNPSVSVTDPFDEVDLEEPPWSDELRTSPEAPSSVLPFFTFSSS